MKAYEMNDTDVIRFVLRRAEWDVLIRALASAAAWAPSDRRQMIWDALDALKVAEVDLDASKMVNALSKIAEYTKDNKDNGASLVHRIASVALDVESKKEGE